MDLIIAVTFSTCKLMLYFLIIKQKSFLKIDIIVYEIKIA